jgi:hypothetical protein
VVSLPATPQTRTAALALAFSPDCDASSNTLQCRLDSVLHFLYATGILLGVVLIVISIVAVRIYYKNKRTRILKKNAKSPRT